VSNATPTIGETVTIRWQYRQDQFEVTPNDRLTGQVIQFASLTIEGEIFSDTRGCVPEKYALIDRDATDNECISLDQREVQFTFNGPVMFRVFGFAENGYFTRAFKLRLQDMSFVVDVDQLNSNSRFPYIFGAFATSGMEFERAFGIYEVPDSRDTEDGVIDEAAPGGDLSVAFLTTVETLDGQTLKPPFFASSSKPEEAEHFGYVRGGNLPLLQQGFFDTEEGQFFRDKTHANIVIIGGSVLLEGDEVERVKADSGGEVILFEGMDLQPLLVQIDVRSANISPPQFFICDLHVITPDQGLVISTFAQHNSLDHPGTLGTNEVTVSHHPDSDPILETLTASGVIKGALAGFDVKAENGEQHTPAQSRVNVNWMNIPVFPDKDISGLSNTYVHFN